MKTDLSKETKKTFFHTKMFLSKTSIAGTVFLEKERGFFYNKNMTCFICFPYKEIEKIQKKKRKELIIFLQNKQPIVLLEKEGLYQRMFFFIKKIFDDSFLKHVKQRKGIDYGPFRMFKIPINEKICFFLNSTISFTENKTKKTKEGILYITPVFICFHKKDFYLTISKFEIEKFYWEKTKIKCILLNKEIYAFFMTEKNVSDIQNFYFKTKNNDFLLNKQKKEHNHINLCLKKTKSFVHSIWKNGIEPEKRENLWFIYSGALYLSQINPEEYSILNTKHDEIITKTKDEIEKDVTRSLPIDCTFVKEETIQKIRRILFSYAVRNPSIGYAQSMNIIVSFLLLTVSEEKTFWILVSICEQIFPFHYTQNLINSMVEQRVLEIYIEKYFPDVFGCLTKMNMDFSIITFAWIVALFTTDLTQKPLLKIFDCLFVSGRDTILVFILSIIKQNQKKVLECQNEEQIVFVFKNYMKTISKETKDAFSLLETFFFTAYNYLIKLDVLQLEETRMWCRHNVLLYLEKNKTINKIKTKIEFIYKKYGLDICKNINLIEFCNISFEMFPFSKEIFFYKKIYEKLSHKNCLFFKKIVNFYTEISKKKIKDFIFFLFMLYSGEKNIISLKNLFELTEVFLWMFSLSNKEAMLLSECAKMLNEFKTKEFHENLTFETFIDIFMKYSIMVNFFSSFLKKFKNICY